MIFLGTPHRGSDLANTLSRILSVSFVGLTAKQFVTDLRKKSPALEDLNEHFRGLVSKLKVFSFYETKGMLGPLKKVG
jgi:hypothetical protein